MRAVVWTGERNFEIQDMPKPTPGEGQVLVEVRAAAICNTDFHYADFQSRPPIIPGHEVAGIVVDKTPEVKGLSVGDRVALDPVQRCGKCYPCSREFTHLCPDSRHLGGERAGGGWAEYVAVDAANAHSIPDGVSFAAAALTEPSAVCHQSFRRALMHAGQDVLVIGDGPFGLLHAVIARILGAKNLIVAGHHDERLARIALYSGATTCNTRREDVGELVATMTGGIGVDIAIEATGAGAAPNIGIAALRPRGTLVIFSYIWQPEPPDFGTVSMKELNLVGACRSLDCFEPCLRWMAEGKLPVDAIVDLHLPLERINDAIGQLTERKKDIFKAVLLPGGH